MKAQFPTKSVSVLLALTTLIVVAPLQAQPADGGSEYALAGRVTASATPLAQARVYAYQMSDLSLRQVDTDPVGGFLFTELPAGLFRIIAIKAGFVPAIVLLQRQTAGAAQYLEVDLAPQTAAASTGERDFWKLRSKLPQDVLRDLETMELEAESGGQMTRGFQLAETTVSAMSGANQQFGDSGQMTTGVLGVSGSFGEAEFALAGDYATARSRQSARPDHTNDVSLRVTDPAAGSVRISSSDNQLHRSGTTSPIGLERYQVAWAQDFGRRGSSEMRAELVDESNFFSSGRIQPMGLPGGSRSWKLEGLYSGNVARSSLNAGFRYRQLEGAGTDPTTLIPAQRVDLYGNGQTSVRPRVLVQYGLYSTLRDGSLSLAPQGGVVVDLGSDWQASTMASRKVHADDPLTFDFMPVQYSATANTCGGEEACYQVAVSRDFDDDTEFSVGASHREFDETLRLYFNEDFFDHLESLYLVEGDTLPEVQLSMTRRIAPQIVTRLQSSAAAGGGGTFYAANRRSYENNVRYLVTSLDTRFERTDTGVFVAFHHLEQQLDLIGRSRRRTVEDHSALETQRLQLMLTQDVNGLNLASLALRLNMEVSRGNTSAKGLLDDEELNKRVMGGVAVTF